MTTAGEPFDKLTPEVKTKWLTALRSGKYRQGRGRLLSTNHEQYCCLGVLADIMGWLTQDGVVHSLDGLDCSKSDAIIPPDRAGTVGLGSSAQGVLTRMNDDTWGGANFDTIADWIEANL